VIGALVGKAASEGRPVRKIIEILDEDFKTQTAQSGFLVVKPSVGAALPATIFQTAEFGPGALRAVCYNLACSLAEVVELADTPSDAIALAILYKLLILQLLPFASVTSSEPSEDGQ
jgi:hypothetical protein